MLKQWSIVCVLFLCLTLTAGAELSTPFALKCEYRVNPEGIDTFTPRLFWKLDSTERGQMQSAWQILAASSEAKLAQDQGDLWDSGKVLSDNTIQVLYGGQLLDSFQKCWWKVRVWDQDDKMGAWSEAAFWSMGVLSEKDWAGAKWIGMPKTEVESTEQQSIRDAHWVWHVGGEAQVQAPVGSCFFRTQFTAPPDSITKALLLLAVDNTATIYLNGQQLGKWSTYQSAGTFLLQDHIVPGINTLAVEADNAGANPNPAGLLALIQLETASNTLLNWYSDATWKSSYEKEAGWEKTSFDDKHWESVQVMGKNGIEPWPIVNVAEDRVLHSRMLRNEFEATGAVARATVSLSGQGLSELYLNGQKISDHVLSPGLTQYDKRIFYVTHDVTDAIREGQNAVGIWLGNGRYYAPRTAEPTRTETFGLPEARMVLHLEYENGTTETITTDLDWRITEEGPISKNNEYDGESYDARRELPGWAEVGFNDSSWQQVQELDTERGVLSAQMMEPLRVVQLVHPIALSNPKPGVYIYDMGQNMVGWVRMKVRGTPGTRVVQRFAEVIKDDGTLYLDNIRGAKVTNEYYLKGGGEEVWEPRFTYFGFRYLEITGFPGVPSLDDIVGCVVHDDVATAGHFHCSNKLVNKIADNIRWGVRGNYRSFPTDCPQRDERQAWLGDRSAESQGETYLYDIAALYAKWVCDMEDAQRESGSVSDVSPAYWPLYNDNVTWPSSFILIPGMLHRQYGDLTVMARHYDGMKKWITHMSGYMEDGIMPKDTYGDWCVPPEAQHLIHSKDPARRTQGEFLGTAYFIHDLRCMEKYATLLGKELDAEKFGKAAEDMTAAFNRVFYQDELGHYINGTETSCVLPLVFDLAPEDVRTSIFNHLVHSIMEKGQGHLSTGLIGGQWLMRALTQGGRPDVAWTLASQTTYPSWGYMVSKNATTIWELWNGDTADPAMNSHNHVMLVGDLNIWLYEHLGGIRPVEPGFKTMLLDPSMPEGLDFAEASYDSIHGQIFSRWERTETGILWRVRIPANTQATVVLPTEDTASILESGKAVQYSTDLEFIKTEGGKSHFAAGSGWYEFIIAAN